MPDLVDRAHEFSNTARKYFLRIFFVIAEKQSRKKIGKGNSIELPPSLPISPLLEEHANFDFCFSLWLFALLSVVDCVFLLGV